jgi:hypothetical protein
MKLVVKCRRNKGSKADSARCVRGELNCDDSECEAATLLEELI